MISFLSKIQEIRQLPDLPTVKIDIEDLYAHVVRIYDKNPSMYNPRQLLCGFTLSQLKGCCGVLVCSYPFALPNLKEITDELIKRIAVRSDYGLLIRTDIEDSFMLPKGAWRTAISFVNPKTDNTVKLFRYDLEDFIGTHLLDEELQIYV